MKRSEKCYSEHVPMESNKSEVLYQCQNLLNDQPVYYVYIDLYNRGFCLL